jgi:acyl-CoA thioesterase FadM
LNLWWRLLWLLLLSRWRPRIDAPFGTSRLALRVWLGDLDTSMHMNNGRYWTLMDLGRTDLMLRFGLWRAVLRNRWVPILNTGAIRFRRELRLLDRLWLDTRIIGWDDTHFIIQHNLIAADRETIAATALVRAGLYDRRRRSFVPTEEVLEAAGITTAPAQPAPAEATLLAEIGRVIRARR